MGESTSLLKAEASQPLLFSREELGKEFIGDPARKGQYTAEELFAERPEVYKEIVRLLAENTSIRAIKRMCKVHHYTVQAVATREGQTIDTLRLSLGKRCLQTAALMVESVEEAVLTGRLKPESMPFAISVLIDKGQVLSGGVTARVEGLEKQPESPFRDFIEAAKPVPGKVIEAETAETGSAAEGFRAIGEGGAAAISGDSEEVSLVEGADNRVAVGDVTASETGEGRVLEGSNLDDQGGRGSVFEPPPVETEIG